MTDAVADDRQQRARALLPGKSFIVQAPAGSGKTELLTQRYLRLLSLVDHPEAIVAITFTRKAAAEMRNRILAALDAATGDPPSEAHRQITWQLARDALTRDQHQGWQIARNPQRLRVQTFDSLSHGLARQLPLLSELGAPPATIELATPHYREAARATLRLLEDDTLGEAIACLLVHMDNRQGQLEDLLCSMLARRDQWLSQTLQSVDAEGLERALEGAVCEHLQQLQEACPTGWLEELAVHARSAAAHLIGATPGDGSAALHTAWHARDQLPNCDWQDLAAWKGLAQLLLTAQGAPRRSWDARIGFPPPGEKGISATDRDARKQAKAEMLALCAALNEDPQLLSLWRTLATLPQHGLDARQRAVLSSLLQVLLHAAAELQLVFQQHGEVDFSEIQMRAQRALGDPQAPTELALALDYRLQHLLVDEFQDTSSSQYRLLATLIAGWQRDDGCTLFAVGDPMQSIYRFREAEVGLYLHAWQHGIGQLRLEQLTLSVNFRSQAGVVDWINRSFPAILPPRVDAGRGAVPYTPAIANHRHDDPLAVQVHAFADQDPQAEAARVVALIRQALGETGDGRIAVLARARSHLLAIAAALKAEGLSYQAVDVDPLAQLPVVRDLYALTRALLHPGDRLAWLVVLRAPWLGLSLADLLALAENSRRTIPGLLRDPAVRGRLSEDAQRRCARWLQIIDPQLPARGRRPLRQWIESIWLRLGGPAIVGPAAESDAEAYLQLLDQHEQARGLVDFAALQTALERLYARPDSSADGRIQLMTMHKAKGLEFDTVILPGLGRRPRGADSELLYWLERTAADGQTQLLMAPIRAADQQDEPISNYLRALNRDKDRLETARLLYVAATRAQRRLHLLGHINFNRDGEPCRPGSDSLLAALWSAVGSEFEALQPPSSSPPEPTPAAFHELRRLPADWQCRPASALAGLVAAAPADVPARIEFDWAGDTARHVGTLVHRQLERIASEGVRHWSAERAGELRRPLQRGLSHLGVAREELDAATEKALQALQNTLNDQTGRWILDDHDEAHCEWALTVYKDRPYRYVIDRSFVDGHGVRWIIDYKTGDHLAGDTEQFLDQELARYREQLEGYAAILRQLEDRPIRLALYFPLFAAWRSWDYAPPAML